MYCHFPGDHRSEESTVSYTAVFRNEASSPINVYWIDFNGKETLYGNNLSTSNEYRVTTYFTHRWIFRKSVSGEKLAAHANGLSGLTFEGESFQAKAGTTTLIEIKENGISL